MVFLGFDMKFFLSLRAGFLHFGFPGSSSGAIALHLKLFLGGVHISLAIKSSGVPDIFQYFSNLIGNLNQTYFAGHKMAILGKSDMCFEWLTFVQLMPHFFVKHWFFSQASIVRLQAWTIQK